MFISLKQKTATQRNCATAKCTYSIRLYNVHTAFGCIRYTQHSVRNLCCINNTAHFSLIVILATQQTRFKKPNGQYKCLNSA